jgi:hypothetical protein
MVVSTNLSLILIRISKNCWMLDLMVYISMLSMPLNILDIDHEQLSCHLHGRDFYLIFVMLLVYYRRPNILTRTPQEDPVSTANSAPPRPDPYTRSGLKPEGTSSRSVGGFSTIRLSAV